MKLFIIIYIFSVNILSSQSILNNWELKNTYECIMTNSSPDFYKPKLFNGELFNIIKSNDKLLIYKFKNSTQLNLASLIGEKYLDYLLEFQINNKYIICLGFKTIYIFKHNNLENITFIKRTDINVNLKNIKIENEKVFLTGVEFSEDNCEFETQTIVMVLNLNTYELENIYFDNIHGVDLANFSPRKMIDYNEGIITVADIDRYEINFYDTTGSYLYTIGNNPDEWISTTDEIPVYDCGIYLANHLADTRRFNSEISQIMRSEFINNSTFMVTWSVPLFNDDVFATRYDIYKKTKGKWKLVEDSLKDFIANDNDNFTSNSVKIFNSFYIREGLLYSIQAFPSDLIKFETLTNLDFNKILENYYFENDLKYTCFIYKLND